MSGLTKAIKFLGFIALAGCTFEARLADLGSSLVGSTPDGSGTIQITAPYITPTNSASFPLSGSCKEEGSQVEVLNSTTVIGTTTCSGGMWSINLDLSAEADGVISVSARLTDSTGTSVSTSPIDIVKDTTAPNVAGLGPLADGAYGNTLTDSPALTWNAATDGGSGLDHYEIAIGTTAGATDISNWTTVGNVTSNQRTGLTLVEGSTYYPSIRAVDKAGNISAVVSGDGWVVDTTGPSLPLSFKDMNFGSIMESPLMTWGASTETGSGLASYQVALGTTPGATDVLNWQSVGTGVTGNLTGLSLTNGQIYYPSLRAIDNVGNISNVTQDNGFRAVGKWKNQEPALPAYLNGSSNAVRIQPDNKRILAGDFTRVSSVPLFRGGRLNADGSVDTSFSMGVGFNNTVRSIARQSDGKVLFSGHFTTYNGATQNRITRLNADGTRDASFDIGLGFGNTVVSIALQSDGKILAGGTFTSFNGTTQNYIARLNADGTLDTTFDIGTGFNNGVEVIVPQSDGKIIVGGWFTSYNGTPKNHLIRLNADGTIDTTFDIGTGFSDTVYSIAIQSDGKIVVGGAFILFNGASQNYLIRLNADGTKDTGFNIGTGFGNQVSSIAIQSDGKIVAVGVFNAFAGTTQNQITRLNTDGSRDTSFIGTGANLTANVVTLQDDGKILVGGTFTAFNGSSQNYITRLNADGTQDLTFDIGIGFNSTLNALIAQSDGKILVGGVFQAYRGTAQNRITRLNADGTSDTAFSIGNGFNSSVYSLALQNDGKILAGGTFTFYNGASQNRITRLNTDGTQDTTFSIGTGFNGTIYAIAIQNDGKILVGGAFSTYNGVSKSRIMRLNSDGTEDTTFNTGTGFNNSVRALAIQSDGKILVGGSYTSYNGTAKNRITRLNSDGSLDNTFNIGAGFDNNIHTLAIQPDGKILAGGEFITYDNVAQYSLIRINTDGTRDATFNIGTNVSSAVLTVQLQTDGKILVGGLFTAYGSTPQNYITRVNSDGSLDTSFNSGSGFESGSAVKNIDLQSDGKILVGGAFVSYDSQLTGSAVLLGW